MFRIGRTKKETYPLAKCNLQGLISHVYIVPTPLSVCPKCGGKLIRNYVYAVQVSKTQCIKIRGDACPRCAAYYSQERSLFFALKNMRINKHTFILKRDYDVSYDSAKYSHIFKKTKSAYRQFILYKKDTILTYTVVYDKSDINESENIIYFSDRVAVELLTAENTNSAFVTLSNEQFVIVNIRKSTNISDEIISDINTTSSSKAIFNNEMPNLTTKHILYVYDGNIKCHTRHHVSAFKAHINIPNYSEMRFYVEYCYECNRFLMKYSDYAAYLKRFHFFPLKVERIQNQYSNKFDRANYSPLFLNGYTTNANVGYSAKERQVILSYILDYGIIEKRDVLNYIEMFIKDNHGPVATQKYIEDRDFVLNYQLDSLPLVEIFELKKRNS